MLSLHVRHGYRSFVSDADKSCVPADLQAKAAEMREGQRELRQQLLAAGNAAAADALRVSPIGFE